MTKNINFVLIALVINLLASACVKENMKEQYEIDYDQAYHLDAESLAEMGIREAYEKVLIKLSTLVETPLNIEEIRNEDNTKYIIKFNNKEHLIYDESTNSNKNSWGNATYVFFEIINSQLVDKEIKFYAVNGGNDLFGIFLTEKQAKASRNGLNNPKDWPYIPKNETP